MIIPCYGFDTSELYWCRIGAGSLSPAYTIQYNLFPGRIVEAFPRFSYIGYQSFYMFHFLDENGTHYILSCIRKPVPSPIPGQTNSSSSDEFQSCVSLSDSINPDGDMCKFIDWLLSQNFCTL